MEPEVSHIRDEFRQPEMQDARQRGGCVPIV